MTIKFGFSFLKEGRGGNQRKFEFSCSWKFNSPTMMHCLLPYLMTNTGKGKEKERR